MTDTVLTTLTEDELDILVSIAIRRAEILDDSGSPAANEAWREVMVYEERLSAITGPEEIPGGVARVGAVAAALAAGERQEAACLASHYLAEDSLPSERRAAIERVFAEDRERLARRFPALAKSGRLAELDEWRANASRNLRVFPRAA
jgi:transcriptional regulator GlxA family with amidase domain